MISGETEYAYKARLEKERLDSLPITKGHLIVEPVTPYCGHCGRAMYVLNWGADWEQAQKEPSGGWLVRAVCDQCNIVARVPRWQRIT